MRVLKLLPLVLVLLLISSTVVQAGFWDSIKKSLKQVQSGTPSGIVDPSQQQQNKQPIQAPKPQSPPPPTMQDVLKQQQPKAIPPPNQENIPKPDSRKVFREATNTQNAKDTTNNKVPPSVAKKSDFFTPYPIILVHGLDGSTESLFRLQYQLAADGIAENKGNIVSTSTTSQLCPDGWPKAISVNFEYYENQVKNLGIKVYADRLAKAIEILKSCTRSTKFNIVAHSMGGLVSRTYLANDGTGSVNRLIMLETPNYGSSLSKLAKPDTVRALKGSDAELMIPGSSFLNELNSKDCSYRNKMVNIISTLYVDEFLLDSWAQNNQANDPCYLAWGRKMKAIFVTPNDALLYGTKEKKLAGCTHSSITNPMDCPKAYENVKIFLR